MSDDHSVDEMMERIRRRQEAAEQEARQSLVATCDRLTEMGVTLVDITYDGCGDDGTIEAIAAHAGDNAVPLPDDLVEALTDAAYGLLPGGWELNEGSFGQLVLNVATRTINRQHNWRSTDYDEEEFEL